MIHFWAQPGKHILFKLIWSLLSGKKTYSVTGRHTVPLLSSALNYTLQIQHTDLLRLIQYYFVIYDTVVHSENINVAKFIRLVI